MKSQIIDSPMRLTCQGESEKLRGLRWARMIVIQREEQFYLASLAFENSSWSRRFREPRDCLSRKRNLRVF
jgi:hypothetical protein